MEVVANHEISTLSTVCRCVSDKYVITFGAQTAETFDSEKATNHRNIIASRRQRDVLERWTKIAVLGPRDHFSVMRLL